MAGSLSSGSSGAAYSGGGAPELGKLSSPQRGGRQLSARSERRLAGRRRGGNPNVPEGAFGGAEDVSAEEGLINRLFGVGRSQGGNDTNELLQMLAKHWSNPANQTIRPREAFMAEREAAIGPERTAQENYQARLASDPWAAGGLFEGRTAKETMSPEAILASQGTNAMNQWAQLGGLKGINQDESEKAQ